jgi:hypothetical protein
LSITAVLSLRRLIVYDHDYLKIAEAVALGTTVAITRVPSAERPAPKAREGIELTAVFDALVMLMAERGVATPEGGVEGSKASREEEEDDEEEAVLVVDSPAWLAGEWTGGEPAEDEAEGGKESGESRRTRRKQTSLGELAAGE